MGPVGLLVRSCHLAGAALDNAFTIKQAHETDINILTIPWQHLRPSVADVIKRGRGRQAALVRTALKDIPEVDDFMTRRILSRADPSHRNILISVVTLGRWEPAALRALDYSDDQSCRFVRNQPVHGDTFCVTAPPSRTYVNMQALTESYRRF